MEIRKVLVIIGIIVAILGSYALVLINAGGLGIFKSLEDYGKRREIAEVDELFVEVTYGHNEVPLKIPKIIFDQISEMTEYFAHIYNNNLTPSDAEYEILYDIYRDLIIVYQEPFKRTIGLPDEYKQYYKEFDPINGVYDTNVYLLEEYLKRLYDNFMNYFYIINDYKYFRTNNPSFNLEGVDSLIFFRFHFAHPIRQDDRDHFMKNRQEHVVYEHLLCEDNESRFYYLNRDIGLGLNLPSFETLWEMSQSLSEKLKAEKTQ